MVSSPVRCHTPNMAPSQRPNKSTYWTRRYRGMLNHYRGMRGNLARADDNLVDKRCWWMLGHLARADDRLVDKRCVWQYWQHALELAEVFDEGYRARRDEHFPEIDWDWEQDGNTAAHNANVYLIMIYEPLYQAQRDFERALHCRSVLLKACRNAQADWRREAARLGPQPAPPSSSSPP
jgi:hypothetical protein